MLPKPDLQSKLYQAFYIDRVIQHATIELMPNKNIHIFNCHLEAFDASTRRYQLNSLYQLMMNYKDKPSFFIGDFNEPLLAQNHISTILSNDPLTTPLEEDPYVDCLNVSSDRDCLTFPSDHPTAQLDYILINPEFIHVTNEYTLQGPPYPSDHLPVISEWSLQT